MTGLLLINVGTPQAPRAPEVRRYLAQFLSDERVIDVNPVLRYGLLYGAILPFRPKQSAHAYQKVWTDAGSPLLVFSQALATALSAKLGNDVAVEVAMRYGEPSLDAALARLYDKGVSRIVVAPLYPHYAASSTGTSLQAIYEQVARRWVVPRLAVLEPFYDKRAFLDAFVAVGRPILDELQPDHVLFSYHGLPERQVQKCDPTGAHCLRSESCCDAIVTANRDCYRAQCFATTRSLVAGLGLDPAKTSTTFQSRLGRTPWIKPYTDEVLPQLAQQGVKRIAVFCPAFVADCLETLEEIGMRADETFRAAGGERLQLVPSLNASPVWVDGLAKLLRPLF